MRFVLGLITAVAVLAAGCSSVPASSTTTVDEHAAHHPGVAAAPVDTAKYDRQLKMMHEMHQKMAAAKTPEERAALMKEQMKTMQDGMAMMGQMGGMMGGGMGMGMAGKAPGGASMPMDADTMQRRMDMMQMMMQMMMDREGMKTPATK
jgi:hypothetical protein